MASETVSWTQPLPEDCRGGAVSVGNFDGVHLGHAALAAELRRQAAAVGGPAVALTFEPHPLALLRPGQNLPALTTAADRAGLLRAHGADRVLVLDTTPDLLRLSAAEFFDRVLRERLAVRALVEGVNFGFGRNREGNVETLARLCREAGLPLAVVPPVEVGGRPVSSSRVRAALQASDVREAAALLGRPYRLRGVVGRGRQRGQTLGFPTANLECLETLVPGEGVYAVRARWREEEWPAAANVGPNPTFGEEARKVEVHLIGFQGELFGQPLAVDFVERLRDTRAFASAAQLVEQIRADVEQARRVLEVAP